MISSCEELKERFFVRLMGRGDIENLVIPVSTKIRREWLLNERTIIIEGKVRNFVFTDLKGGVWEAKLK